MLRLCRHMHVDGVSVVVEGKVGRLVKRSLQQALVSSSPYNVNRKIHWVCLDSDRRVWQSKPERNARGRIRLINTMK